jgi:hypothetical protein
VLAFAPAAHFAAVGFGRKPCLIFASFGSISNAKPGSFASSWHLPQISVIAQVSHFQ